MEDSKAVKSSRLQFALCATTDCVIIIVIIDLFKCKQRKPESCKMAHLDCIKLSGLTYMCEAFIHSKRKVSVEEGGNYSTTVIGSKKNFKAQFGVKV